VQQGVSLAVALNCYLFCLYNSCVLLVTHNCALISTVWYVLVDINVQEVLPVETESFLIPADSTCAIGAEAAELLTEVDNSTFSLQAHISSM
jgi:hypothetical protein